MNADVDAGATAIAGERGADAPIAGSLVSVVVRSMARPTLAAALDSIAMQGGVPVEIVVVAAAGASHPPLAAAAGAHRVRLITSDHALGRAAAANAGLDAVRGEWITFLDDDDVLLPGHLAGLLAAHREMPAAQVVHGLARALFTNGRTERVGQPHAVIELYDRNYLSLSTAIMARALLDVGCRFDETLEVLEDWDFFLQLAQHTRFHFTPRETFQWHADVGTSGAGGGSNQDDARFAQNRDRVDAKWASRREAHVERVSAILRVAEEDAHRGDLARAEAGCRSVLAMSQNDPWALNLLAMVLRTAGDLGQARTAQELAVAVRPTDAALVHNLGLVALAQRDTVTAQACCARALALDPQFAPARKLHATLQSASAPASGS